MRRAAFLSLVSILSLVGCSTVMELEGAEGRHISDQVLDSEDVGQPTFKRTPRFEDGGLSVVGPYTVYERSVHGTRFRVAYHPNFDDSAPESEVDQAQYLLNVWDYYWHIFGGFPFKTYTIVFRGGATMIGGAHGAGYEVEKDAYGFGPEWIPNHSNAGKHTHEIFHAWNGNGDAGINAKPSADGSKPFAWFTEGVSRYYDHRALAHFWQYPMDADSRADVYNAEMHQGVLRVYLQNIVGTDDDISLVEMGRLFHSDSERRGYAYRKGALVAYLIDLELRGYGSSLDEMMRYLYTQYSHGARGIDTEDVRSACETLTGADFSAFFDNYVYGNTRLPFTEDTVFEFLE